MKKCIVIALLAWFASAPPAHAAAIMWYQQIGVDVDATLSGSLNLTGMTPEASVFDAAVNVAPNIGAFGTGQAGDDQTGFVNQITGPSSFGPGGTSVPSSSSGAAVFLFGAGNDFWVPVGYVSGSPLSATQTFTNRTFANLGLTPGDYVYTLLSGDTLTVRVGPAPAPVPEPASLFLLSLGLAGIGVRRWRQRDAA